jgi:hypothetical protein
MKRWMMLAVMLLAVLPIAAGAQTVKRSMKGGKPYLVATDKVTAQATVLKVNHTTRQVTLRTESGDTTRVTAGPEVKNFAQIRVKDVVKVSYTEKLTIELQPAGTPESTTELQTSHAKPGEKPGASASQKTTYKATIEAIDKTAGTVTLKGYDGKETTVTPLHKENLDKVAVGDLVVFTYTESIAASVEEVTPAPKTPAKAPAKK